LRSVGQGIDSIRPTLDRFEGALAPEQKTRLDEGCAVPLREGRERGTPILP
jgi:hypothetical protein